MGDIGFMELVAIVIIAILLYGKDLPQAARKLAGMYSRFRRHLTDIKDEIQRSIPEDEVKSALNPETYLSDTEPPSAPYGLSVSPSNDQVYLSWVSSAGATSYTLKRSKGPSDPFLVVAMNLTDLSYTDTDVEPGKTYHYVVVAHNGAGESPDSDEAIAEIPGSGATTDVPAASSPPAASPPAPEPPPADNGHAQAGHGTPPTASSETPSATDSSHKL